MILPTWLSWVLALAVLAFVAMMLGIRRGHSGAGVVGKDAVEGNRAARVTRVIAWLYVATCVVSGVGSTFSTLWGRDVTLKLPVKEFWPTLPASVDLQAPPAAVVSGGFKWANVSVSGLDTSARMWLAGGVLAQTVIAVIAGLVIVTLCSSVLNKTYFAARLVRGVRQVAAVVLLGGLVWQICQIVGGTLAAGQVLGVTAWGMAGQTVPWTDIHTIIGMPSVAYEWEFNFWPFAVGLALFVLAELLRQGRKVQADAEGLI